MKVLRFYADALGESRFETTTMPMALKEFAPPAAPLRVSDPQPAQNYVILEVGPKWGGAVPHPAPARMMTRRILGEAFMTSSLATATCTERQPIRVKRNRAEKLLSRHQAPQPLQ